VGNNELSWLLGASTTVIASLLGISAYFIQKWIASVDAHLEGNTNEIKDIKIKLSEIRSEQKTIARSITETVGIQLRSVPNVINRNEIDKAIKEIKEVAEKPAHRYTEIKGKIIHIVDRQDATDKKVETLYNTVKIIVDRIKPK
jgi:nitrogenase molybdenum-iron protein alpha/beta subunit